MNLKEFEFLPQLFLNMNLIFPRKKMPEKNFFSDTLFIMKTKTFYFEINSFALVIAILIWLQTYFSPNLLTTPAFFNAL